MPLFPYQFVSPLQWFAALRGERLFLIFKVYVR